MSWFEAFRVPEQPPPNVRTLHGPWQSGAGPCWPTPYRHAWGRPDFEAEARRAPGSTATERWEHGRLVEVVDEARWSALAARWGAERCADARVGTVSVPAVSQADRDRIAHFCARGWLRQLVRAFEHAGCKAARIGCLEPAALADFGDLGDALLAARQRPRVAVLEGLLATRRGAAGDLFAELDALDVALDQRGMGGSWVRRRVPDHTLALWPLRNLMRLAERQGVIFREMRFREYEAQVAYAPEMPVVCLDHDIYGGGFEHDLFHLVAPVPLPEDPVQYEVGLLAVEAAGQAFNSLVLGARHSGPAYEGYATWPGAALFEQLERAFGLPTISQQIAAFRIVALVCHPDFEHDPVESWLDLVPPGADRWTVESLVARYRRYVVRDAEWLRGLRARYATPVFGKWRPCIDERLTTTIDDALRSLDAIIAGVEEVDLQSYDCLLLGRAAEALQANRHTLLKVLELEHLVELANGRGSPLRGLLDRIVERTRGLDDAWGALRERGRALTAVAPDARAPEELSRLEHRIGELQRLGATRDDELTHLVHLIRERQRVGRFPTPEVPSDFATTFSELFHRVYYDPPIHVGADLPGIT